MPVIEKTPPRPTDVNQQSVSPIPETPEPTLRRELSLLDSTMINVGSMIGSGIFLVPATIALTLHSGSSIVLVWVVGGIISLFGALATAELGALFPNAGGQYIYLEKAYGPVWGFLYGWSAFAVILSAAISAVAVGFATYVGYFFALSPLGIKSVAITSIVILTVVNCYGVRSGALVQNTLTFAKVALLGAMVALSFFISGGPTSGGTERWAWPMDHIPSLGSFGLALVAVLWAYDGWIEITYVAGEVKDPQRTLPRSLIFSTLLVILIYVLTNITYVSLLPVPVISHSTMVAADAAKVLIGPIGGAIAVIGVMIATLGSNNGFILTGARIYYAMSSERLFFASFAKIHRRFRTPVASLIGQGLWASVLVLTGTFNELITYVIFASWIFYGMTAGAVIVLRRKLPEMPRAYKTWGYPYTPIVFMAFSVYLVANTIIESPKDALVGIGIILLGVPAYFYWNRKKMLLEV